MIICGLVFERNSLLVSSDLYHIQAQENLCAGVIDHTPNRTPSMYATHFNYNCWYCKAIIHKLKPHKAQWLFSNSPLGSLSLVIDINPYHSTKYQRTGKKALVTPIFKKGDSDSLANCRHFPLSAVNYSFCFIYGLLSGLGSLLRMFCFLLLCQLRGINYITPEILWARNFHWVQWKADSVYFLCEKKMSKMFAVGEMATNSPRANAGNCNSTKLSTTDFASVCKTSAVSLNLIFRCNEMC